MSKRIKNAVGVKRKGDWRPLERPEPRRYFVSELPRLQPVNWDWVNRFFEFAYTRENMKAVKRLLENAAKKEASIEDFYSWSLNHASRHRTPNLAKDMRAYANSLASERYVIPVLSLRQ